MDLFIKPDRRTILNLNAVAWIKFENSATEEMCASVYFRAITGAENPRLVCEVFSGQTAVRLHQLLFGAERAETSPESTKEADSRSEVTPSRFEDFGKKKAWYFRRVNGRLVLMAFINAKGSCSVRSYDGVNGIFLGKQYRAGNYQNQFSDLLEDATELTVDTQPNLERDCKARLPERVLDYLKNQVT